MIFKSSLNYINQFLFFLTSISRKFYLQSNLYNKKISKINDKDLEYKPSPNLLDCLIKNKKRKNKIEDFSIDVIWSNENLKQKDYKKLQKAIKE